MIRLSRTRRSRKEPEKHHRFSNAADHLSFNWIGESAVTAYKRIISRCGNIQHDNESGLFISSRWETVGREQFEASKQTKTKGTVCAPLTLFAEYKNRGSQIADSEWKWELHKLGNAKKPLEDGTVIDKGAFKKKPKRTSTG